MIENYKKKTQSVQRIGRQNAHMYIFLSVKKQNNRNRNTKIKKKHIDLNINKDCRSNDKICYSNCYSFQLLKELIPNTDIWKPLKIAPILSTLL